MITSKYVSSLFLNTQIKQSLYKPWEWFPNLRNKQKFKNLWEYPFLISLTPILGASDAYMDCGMLSL